LNEVLIYSKQKSNRLEHTLQLVFKQLLLVDYSLVSKKEITEAEDSIKINYSDEPIPGTFQIAPYFLLFEDKIKEQEVSIDWIEKVPYFFKTSSKTDIHYDLFSLVFYMVSRYEEYLDSELDSHGRFQAENSLAFKNNFLELPVVNIWIVEFQKELEKMFPSKQFLAKKYNYINSLDIDIAYAYRGKSKTLLLISTLKNVITFNIEELKNKYNYFFKNKQDPYDTYSCINNLRKKHNNKNLFFFLLGDYGAYDKSISHNSRHLKELIQDIEKMHPVGVHPSYKSNQDQKQLSKEINRLESIIDKKVLKSRQHFLKLTIPSTYENLIEMGIKEDYSMGYASKIGFRAGICTPYPFFNLKTNSQSNLMIHPFQIMDGTLNTYMKLSPEKAIEKIIEMTAVIKSVNGTFVTLWHNSSLSEIHHWENWRKVYQELQDIAKDS
jgi:hypothetical protein